MKKLSLKAFTLIEVLITLAIFTFMMAAIYSTMLISQRSWNIYADTTAPKQSLRAVLPAMARELREAQDLFITKEPHNIQVTFKRPKYGELKYSWTDEGKDAGKIIRSNYANETVLAYNIKSLSFSSQRNNEIIIEVSGRTKSSNDLKLAEKVVLRAQTGVFAESQNEQIK